jgi:hypothetical protein
MKDKDKGNDKDKDNGLGMPILEKVKHVAYMKGYPNGSFGPGKPITRAEAAAIFYRLIVDVNKEMPLVTTFSDIKSSDWYAQAVAYLTEQDVIQGYPDGTFGPGKTITRAEFAAMASRFETISYNAIHAFSDVPSDYWASEYITSVYAKGWMQGFIDGTFKPNHSMTRAEVVTMVNRMLERKIEKKSIPTHAKKYNDVNEKHWAYQDIVEASTFHEYTRQDDGYEIWK